MNAVLFFQGASFTVATVSRKVCWSSAKGKQESQERERGAHSRRGVGIVRFARGDNLQEMAEMDWQSMFFSPIEKSPSRGNRERVRVFY